MKKLEILLVEDNFAEITLVKEFFKDKDMIPHNLHIVTDGIQAIEFLKKQDKYIDRLTIDIILLDVHLPKKNGDEVLKEIKQDNNLKSIPVVILNSVNDEEFIEQMYTLQAYCCITKPIDTYKFLEIFEGIKHNFTNN